MLYLQIDIKCTEPDNSQVKVKVPVKLPAKHVAWPLRPLHQGFAVLTLFCGVRQANVHSAEEGQQVSPETQQMP